MCCQPLSRFAKQQTGRGVIIAVIAKRLIIKDRGSFQNTRILVLGVPERVAPDLRSL